MPHKRKNRSRRVQLTSTNSNPCIKNDTDLPMNNMMSAPPIPTRQRTPPPPPPPTFNKFAVPQINTMVRAQAEFKSVQNMSVELNSNLSPRCKAAIAPKAVKKLNIPANHRVFRDLIPINVNDSLREMERPRTLKTKESTKSITSEPSLSDYVEKIERVQLVMPEPDLVLDFPHEEFDFLNTYRDCYRYN